jgi:hypothetical protein
MKRSQVGNMIQVSKSQYLSFQVLLMPLFWKIVFQCPELSACSDIMNINLRLWHKGVLMWSLVGNHQTICPSTRGISCSIRLVAFVRRKVHSE